MYSPILAQSSICHGLIRRFVIYCCIFPANGSSERNFALPDTTFSRNSQFINLIGRCIAIEFVASLDSEGASATNIHSHSFPRAYPRARPFPPYSFSEKTESGRKRIKNDSGAVKKKWRKKNHRTSKDPSEPARPAIFVVLTPFSRKRSWCDTLRRNITYEDAEKARLLPRSWWFLVDKDMEMLPRQGSSKTPALRQIN